MPDRKDVKEIEEYECINEADRLWVYLPFPNIKGVLTFFVSVMKLIKIIDEKERIL